MSTNEDERDVARGLVATLLADAEPVDEGHFTIDPAVALAKLRANQLVDPRDYLFLLVEAAALVRDGNESGIRIELGTRTSVEFGGLALSAATLADLFSAALTGASSSAATPARVLHLLGLAANAALALEPRRLSIMASDVEGRASQIVIAPGGELSVVAASEATMLPPSTIRFEVHGRRTWTRRSSERERLCERCRHTSLPVWVDGQRVSFGPTAMLTEPATATTRAELQVDGRAIGVVGHTVVSRALPRLVLVNRGVACFEALDAEPGVEAVVEVDLPVDLSRTKLLESADLDAVRASVAAQLPRLARRSEPTPQKPALEPPRFAREWPLDRGSTIVVMVLGLGLLGETMRTLIPNEPSERAAPTKPARAKKPRSHAQRVLACVDEHDPIACGAMVHDARVRAAQGDVEALGVALVLSCFAIAGRDCIEAADYVARGHYPSDGAKRTDYGPFPATSEAALLERACAAEVPGACR